MTGYTAARAGWTVVGEDAQDAKLYRREVMRLEMALKSAQRVAQGATGLRADTLSSV